MSATPSVGTFDWAALAVSALFLGGFIVILYIDASRPPAPHYHVSLRDPKPRKDLN